LRSDFSSDKDYNDTFNLVKSWFPGKNSSFVDKDLCQSEDDPQPE
jgi:hypothetical protein